MTTTFEKENENLSLDLVTSAESLPGLMVEPAYASSARAPNLEFLTVLEFLTDLLLMPHALRLNFPVVPGTTQKNIH